MSWPRDLEVKFETPDGALKPGFHLTSLTSRREQSVDCGGARTESQVSVMQFLDGLGGPGMTAETFQIILKQSVVAVPGLQGGALRVEFGHLNKGLNVYEVAEIIQQGQNVVVLFRPITAFCSPMKAALTSGVAGCCGNASPRQSACCG